MRKSLTLFVLLMLAFVCPAVAQQIVIDEITIQGAESYTVNQDMVVRFKVNNNSGVPLEASDYSLTVNVGGVYAGKPAATKAIANGSYESFMAKVAPHMAGENLPVEIVFKGMGTVKTTAEETVTVNAEVPSGNVQIGNCASPRSDVDYGQMLNTYYNYSQTEAIYTAADLDLSDGTMMTGLSFTGYRSNERQVPVKVWVELTDDVAPASKDSYTLYTSDDLIKVYDDTYSFQIVGDEYNHEPVFEISFPTPIKYVAGKSLRVIVQTEKAASYSYTYISLDKTKRGQVVSRCIDSSLEGLEAKQFKDNSYGTYFFLPVLLLGIEKDPTVVDGTVTILNKSKNVEPLANATVALANGNVMYFATTDAEGKYSMEVCQDKLTYDVTVEPADVQIFPFAETLALAGASATKDLQVTEASGAYILSADIPSEGVVNNVVTVKANIADYDATELTNDNAEIVLYMDGEKVANAEDFFIDAYDNDDVTLTFTPHEAGVKELTLEVVVEGMLHHSATAEINVSQEMASGDVTMGEGQELSYVANAPVRLYSEHSYSQTLITSDLLSNLAAGSKVTGLKLESASGKDKGFNIDLKVWIMNTEDGTDNVKIDPYSTDLKQVYTGTLKQRQHGKVGETPTEFENFIDIIFDEPFVYEGKNIRIAMQADNAGSYQTTYFKALKNVTTSYQKSTDSAGEIKDRDWASSAEKTPVFTFVVDNASIITGTVVDSSTGLPLEAEVKLVADDADIIYSAAADAAGFFELSVIQADHNFTATISAEGYDPATTTVEASFVAPLDLGTISLQKSTSTGISDINAAKGDGAIYDITGRKVANKLGRGIYVVNGKKILK